MKRSGAFMNLNPITISIDSSFAEVKRMQKRYSINSFLVVEKSDDEEKEGDYPLSSPRRMSKQILGILTARDILGFDFDDQLVKDFMTPVDKLIYYEVDDSQSPNNCDLNALLLECKKLLFKNKIEKIPILNSRKEIVGLVSLKDIIQY